MSKVTALIPAAGMGKRMGRAVAKQFLPLGERPLLAHALLTFQRAPEIDEIIPILAEEEMEHCLEGVIEHYHITKVRTLVAGGKERQDSVYQGLQKVGEETEVVLVHDGVRPFVTSTMIKESVELAKKGICAVVGVPLKDTIKEVNAEGKVVKTMERSRLWAIQTPQAFPAKTLKRVYEESYKQKMHGTDDATFAERAGLDVHVIMGSYDNIKVTTPEDLVLAEEILKKR